MSAEAVSPVVGGDGPLSRRYPPDASRVFDPDERRRFLDEHGKPRSDEALRWELLYRLEPELYDRLVAGERLHEGIIEWLPRHCGSVLEVGAGTGRLTMHLARLGGHVTAVEPAGPLRRILRSRLAAAGVDNVDVTRGFFDDLPAGRGHQIVISCSAFCVGNAPDPERCLRAMEDACVPGGCVAVVWPADVGWLRERGYDHVVFEGPMVVEYSTSEEAAALARIFYPDAARAVMAGGSRFVDFTTLGFNAPRDLCWKRVV